MEAVEYLANPINIYLLIKRLTVDWKFAKEKYITKDLQEGNLILPPFMHSQLVFILGFLLQTF